MYWKIEPTGCLVVKKGEDEISIQIRYCFYLEENESGYDKYFVDEMTVISHKSFLEKLELQKTGKKILTPLHNHIILLPIDSSDGLIENVGNQLLHIVKGYYSQGYFDGSLIHIPNTLCSYQKYSSENESIANARLQTIKSNKKWI